MYVRRKVFSVLQDENGEEKLFSVNETSLLSEEEQREYSVDWKKVATVLGEAAVGGLTGAIYNKHRSNNEDPYAGAKKVARVLGGAALGGIYGAGLNKLREVANKREEEIQQKINEMNKTPNIPDRARAIVTPPRDKSLGKMQDKLTANVKSRTEDPTISLKLKADDIIKNQKLKKNLQPQSEVDFMKPMKKRPLPEYKDEATLRKVGEKLGKTKY